MSDIPQCGQDWPRPFKVLSLDEFRDALGTCLVDASRPDGMGTVIYGHAVNEHPASGKPFAIEPTPYAVLVNYDEYDRLVRAAPEAVRRSPLTFEADQ